MKKLDHYIDNYLDGLLSADEHKQLGQLLSETPGAVEEFVRRTSQQQAIREIIQGEASAQPHRHTRKHSGRLIKRAKQRRKRKAPLRLLPLLSAALLLCSIGAWFVINKEAPQSQSTPITQTKNDTAETTPPGDQMPGQPHQAHHLADGITIIPSSDARYRIHASGTHVDLEHGDLACQVTPRPQPIAFTIGTANAHLSVLGTVFDASYRKEQSTFTVERGLVCVHDPNTDKRHLLGPGAKLSVSDTNRQPTPSTAIWQTDLSQDPEDAWMLGTWNNGAMQGVVSQSGMTIRTPWSSPHQRQPLAENSTTYRIIGRLFVNRPGVLDFLVQWSDEPLKNRGSHNSIIKLNIQKAGWYHFDLPLSFSLPEGPANQSWWARNMSITGYDDQLDLRLTDLAIVQPHP